MGTTYAQYLHQPSTWPMAPTLANMQQMLTIIQEAPTFATTPTYQPMVLNTMQYQPMSLLVRPIA
jgi:hypothetical protein